MDFSCDGVGKTGFIIIGSGIVCGTIEIKRLSGSITESHLQPVSGFGSKRIKIGSIGSRIGGRTAGNLKRRRVGPNAGNGGISDMRREYRS